MAKQHYELVVKYGYKDIVEHEVPKEHYLKSRYEICKSQIALAGYRLTDWLKEILEAHSVTDADESDK